MTDSNVTHPNFRIGPGQRNASTRTRAVMVTIPQRVFDAAMSRVAAGDYKDLRKFMEAAIESELGLAPGSADPFPSESES